MRRRITEAIVGVAALILLALGIPLAIAVHRSILDSEVVELQAVAARTLTEIDVTLDSARLAAVSREQDAPPPFSVYNAHGVRVFGTGPANADRTVERALSGNQASNVDGEIVVATPITDDVTEKVVGALRLTEGLGGPNHRSRIAWLEMGAAGLSALALGWAIARRLARRLSRPVTELAAAAARIGDGGTLEATTASGIAEIDTLALALAGSAVRVNDSLVRERRFSADVSHQLRTPLTGLRLRLEAARNSEDLDAIEPALADLARLERTLDHLLVFARDAIPTSSTTRLDLAARQARDRWADRAATATRTIRVTARDVVASRGSTASVDQILDVLIDNALHHGRGDIQINARHLPGGGAIDVSDEGRDLMVGDVERIFERGQGTHNGIGLALARSFAEAEGGRLQLARLRPTTFSLFLLDDTDEHD